MARGASHGSRPPAVATASAHDRGRRAGCARGRSVLPQRKHITARSRARPTPARPPAPKTAILRPPIHATHVHADTHARAHTHTHTHTSRHTNHSRIPPVSGGQPRETRGAVNQPRHSPAQACNITRLIRAPRVPRTVPARARSCTAPQTAPARALARPLSGLVRSLPHKPPVQFFFRSASKNDLFRSRPPKSGRFFGS